MTSYTTNPVTNIGVIGWSWWTIQETCRGAITFQLLYGSSIQYNGDYHARLESYYKHGCSGTRVGWSMGNHDFHEFGDEHIYPYMEYSEALP